MSPLKTAIKCVVHLDGLGNIGEKATFTDNQNLVEKYMCSLYGQGSLLSVNDARFNIFLKKYNQINWKE